MNQTVDVPQSVRSRVQGKPEGPEFRGSWIRSIQQAFRLSRARWLAAIVAGHTHPLLEVAAIFLIYAIIEPQARGQLTNYVGRTANYFGLAPPDAMLTIILLAVSAFICIAATVGMHYLNQVLLAHLRIQIYVTHCHQLIDSFLHTDIRHARKVGKDRVINSVMNDCGSLQSSMELGLNLIAGIWAIAIYLLGAAILSWQILLVGFVLYAVPVFAGRHIFRWMRVIGQTRVGSHERMMGHLNDVLQGFERTKSEGLEGLLSLNTTKMLQSTQRWKIDKRVATAKYQAILDGLSLTGILLVLLIGITIIGLELTTLVAAFLLFSRLRGNIAVVTGAAMEIKALIAPIYRYFELLRELEPDGLWSKNDSVHPGQIAPVELSGVCFGYGEERTILENINLRFEAGDRILITGPSGQGKSTLVEILCGLLPPNRGVVSVAGVPLKGQNFYRYRPLITLVTPNVYLFRGSLRDNLLMGKEVSDAEFHKALDLAGLDKVVEAIEGGADGDLGINGDNLSVGQRQRVVLARAYLSQPMLLLLDEATANLDSELEAELITRLQNFLHPDAIVVMVAHKPPKNFTYSRHYKIVEGHLTPIDAPDAAAVTE